MNVFSFTLVELASVLAIGSKFPASHEGMVMGQILKLITEYNGIHALISQCMDCQSNCRHPPH